MFKSGVALDLPKYMNDVKNLYDQDCSSHCLSLFVQGSLLASQLQSLLSQLLVLPLSLLQFMLLPFGSLIVRVNHALKIRSVHAV